MSKTVVDSEETPRKQKLQKRTGPMPTEDILNRDNFGLLPEAEFRWASFGAATITNLTIGALVIFIAMNELHRQVQLKHFQSTSLVFPSEPPPIVKPPAIPKVKVTPPPPVEMAKLAPPKLAIPKIEPPKPIEMPKPVKMDVPTPALPPPPPKAVAPAPQPKLANFATNNPTPVANNTVAPTPKTGGFGNPVGVKANPNADRTATIAAAGFATAAPGAAAGAGAARLGSAKSTNAFGSGVANGVAGGTSKGTVASAGFANGSIGGKAGGVIGGTVSSGNFGGPQYGGSGAAPAVAKTESSLVPPEVTSEPRPQYTHEARDARIQGDVTLRVIFKATGQVIVLGVTQGLGHGLDEEAKRVAEQIRFKPAMKNGQAVDHTTLIHITFQLA
jgi:TonB family protein